MWVDVNNLDKFLDKQQWSSKIFAPAFQWTHFKLIYDFICNRSFDLEHRNVNV